MCTEEEDEDEHEDAASRSCMGALSVSSGIPKALDAEEEEEEEDENEEEEDADEVEKGEPALYWRGYVAKTNTKKRHMQNI